MPSPEIVRLVVQLLVVRRLVCELEQFERSPRSFRASKSSDLPADDSIKEAQQEAGKPEEIRFSDGRIEHPHVDYERRDISFKGVVLVALASICIGALGFFFVFRLFVHEENRMNARRASTFPLVEHPSNALPPEPRLETIDQMAENGAPDVFHRQLEMEKTLQSYGRTSEKSFVHIPIDQAMKLLAGKLPVRKTSGPGSKKDNGLIDAGESNSGRLFRGASR